MWDYEKFHEARLLEIPLPTASNPENSWVARAKAFGSRQCDLRAAFIYSMNLDDDSYAPGRIAPNGPLRLYGPDHAEEESDDDLF